MRPLKKSRRNICARGPMAVLKKAVARLVRAWSTRGKADRARGKRNHQLTTHCVCRRPPSMLYFVFTVVSYKQSCSRISSKTSQGKHFLQVYSRIRNDNFFSRTYCWCSPFCHITRDRRERSLGEGAKMNNKIAQSPIIQYSRLYTYTDQTMAVQHLQCSWKVNIFLKLKSFIYSQTPLFRSPTERQK